MTSPLTLLAVAFLAGSAGPLIVGPPAVAPGPAAPSPPPRGGEGRGEGAGVRGTAPADPVATVREAERRLQAALDAGASPETLGVLAAEYLDYQDLVRRSLGRHWDKLGQADRTALAASLRALLEATYLSRLTPGATARTEVTVVRRTAADAELHLVASSGAQAVPLDLRLARGKDGRWRVYDATVAGLALLEGYQEQFPQLLELGGVKRLLAQLETERRAELARQAAQAAPVKPAGPPAAPPAR